MAISVTRYRKLWRDCLKRTPYPVNVPPRAWDKYFPAETAQLRKIPEFEISKISIDGLRKLATRLPTGTDSNRALFVATMMWGRGPKNGRMMPNFQVAASHREFDKTLSITRESVMQGDFSGAYSQWLSSGIKGIREPFFTKWLFVCGLKNDPGVLQAFTLDGRVRASLRTLEWPDAPLKKTLQGKPALFYEAYLKTLTTWAAELSDEQCQTTPLQVEQFLFRKNGNIPLA